MHALAMNGVDAYLNASGISLPQLPERKFDDERADCASPALRESSDLRRAARSGMTDASRFSFSFWRGR
jgi:hypothetical protein